ncbi:Protein ECM25 [Hanseniaspora osmophila]|uniref:Protein ECM25 n=1 Tax=Hanseniaspora osmophila TaxID=56408 RepID=A0A1E5RHJ1_9ASCO|nr:Protein ECM25 [Hanseniaspora osmophila]
MDSEETTININFSSIFFRSYFVDDFEHPVYVFDSTYLPSFETIGNKDTYDTIIDKLTDKLITRLPNEPYSLVAFTSGFGSQKLSWVYGIKMYAKLPQSSKNYLQKLYIVHESFWVRSVYQVLKNAMNIKFLNNNSNEVEIQYISDLTQLSQIIDITRLRISLNVYLHDYDINEFIEVPKHYFKPKFDLANRQYRQMMFDKIFKRLMKEAVKTDLVFMKPGSFKKVNILLDVIDRNNYVDLSQWDIYSIAGVFLYFIRTKTHTFFPIDMITLPVRDDFEYTFAIFKSMMDFHNYYPLIAVLLPLFIRLIKNQKTTKHDYLTMSKCLVATLCRESVSKENDDRVMIGRRFIKNVLIDFDGITKQMSLFQTTQQTPKTLAKMPPAVPKPRKMVGPNSENATKGIAEAPTLKANEPPTPPPSRSSPTRKNAALLSPQKLAKPNKVLTSTPPPLLPKPKNLSNVSLDALTTWKTVPSSPDKTRTPSPQLFSPEKFQDVSNPRIISETNSFSSSSSDNLHSLSSLSKTDDINKRIRDQPESVDMVTVDEKMVWETIRKLQIDNNTKIQSFDKNLQKEKQEVLLKKRTETSHFSTKSYADFKNENNRVSRLASLYEERLQGLQIMDSMKH